MKQIKNYRWIIIALLFTATCINYLDRQIIGLLKPILEKEFNWTETDFSHIVMAFTAAYAVGLLIACMRPQYPQYILFVPIPMFTFI